MIKRVSAFTLVCLMTWMAQPALAQGLRPSPRLGASGGLARAPAVPASGPRQADFIVAVVNSEPITNNEVRARLARIEQQLAQQGAPMPAPDVLARQVLERLISEKAQLQQAHELGLRVDETNIDQAEQNVARQNQVDVATLRRKLASEGIALKQFRDELRNKILLSKLREREVDARVRVSDLEVDQFIHEQQGSADGTALEINLAQVLVVVPEGASEAQVKALQARAQRVAERARAGEDFAALVTEFSDVPDRSHGGQMGLREADRYPSLFVEATRNVRVGGLVGPVRSGAGFHILKVIEKQQAGLPATITQSHARHILLRTGPQLSEAAARARLTDFRNRILAKQADFATLARENSQDGSAREGGDLGWASPGQFVPEFENVINSLAPGEISQPLTSRFGVHLIQLIERREVKLSEREQREAARNILREKKLDEAYATWAQEVRGRAYVEFREPPQ